MELHPEPTQPSTGLSTRIRDGLALVQHQLGTAPVRAMKWAELRGELRERLLRLMARIRAGLDIPSRSELAELITRLDALDAKLADLETSAPDAGELARLKSQLAAVERAAQARPQPGAHAGDKAAAQTGNGGGKRARNSRKARADAAPGTGQKKSSSRRKSPPKKPA